MKENKSAKIAKDVLSKMDDTDRISFLKTQTEKLCNMTFTFIRQLRDMWKSDGKEVPESDCIAQCMLQMGLMRTRTLLQLAEGQNLIEKSQVFIQDIPSMLSVLRSYYELCFIFHNIFITQQTKEERDIILYLWEIRGLQNRQGLNNVPDKNKKQELQEKKDIENLKEMINALLEQLEVPVSVANDFQKILKYEGTSWKGYYFKKSHGKITEIKDIHLNNGINQIIRNEEAKNLYRFTSFHAHSSYLSVLQFGQMFNNGINGFLETIMLSTYLLLATILYDFCSYSNDALKIINSIDKNLLAELTILLRDDQK